MIVLSEEKLMYQTTVNVQEESIHHRIDNEIQ